MGSPFYMAPEQWSDEKTGRAGDPLCLRVILYQMLAGDVPFKALPFGDHEETSDAAAADVAVDGVDDPQR